MKNTIEKHGPSSGFTAQQGVELGRWMGRRDAFAMIAGGCTAADVESLRRIRDEKHYRAVARNWDEFCTGHLRVSRRKVERTIAYLEEFGPQFFLLKQIMQISPDEYRVIAPHVGSDGLGASNGPVALLPENSEQVAAAVAEILSQKRNSAVETNESGDFHGASFEPILRHCESAARMLESCEKTLLPEDKAELTAVLTRLWRLAGHQCLTVR